MAGLAVARVAVAVDAVGQEVGQVVVPGLDQAAPVVPVVRVETVEAPVEARVEARVAVVAVARGAVFQAVLAELPAGMLAQATRAAEMPTAATVHKPVAAEAMEVAVAVADQVVVAVVVAAAWAPAAWDRVEWGREAVDRALAAPVAAGADPAVGGAAWAREPAADLPVEWACQSAREYRSIRARAVPARAAREPAWEPPVPAAWQAVRAVRN